MIPAELDFDVGFDLPPAWLFLPVGESSMQRVNQWEFYRIGWILHRLGDIKDGTPLIVVKGRLLAAKSWLTYLLDETIGWCL